MGIYILRRLLALIPVMLVASLTIFLIVRLAPGDPASVIAGKMATPDQIEGIRKALALDRPIWLQFAVWLGGVLHGDLGYSFFNNQPVATLLWQRVEPTIALALPTMVLSLIFAVAIGAFAAAGAGSLSDRGIMSFAILGFSVPPFVVGYAFVYVFAVKLGWLPVQGYTPISKGVGSWALHLVMPVMTLSTGYIALISRVVRASLLDVLSEDFVRTARAKGLVERRVILRHGLGNAAVPIVTVAGIGVALLVGGVVVTETVFNIPGIGRLTVDAISQRDYPVIQGIVLVFSAIYVLINLAVDLSYAFFDPRIRYS